MNWIIFQYSPRKKEKKSFKCDVCNGWKRAKQINDTTWCKYVWLGKNSRFFLSGDKPSGCFKNVKNHPLAYFAYKKDWRISEIYEKWLKELDQYFEKKNRKILLIVDNCSTHIEAPILEAKRVVFFPRRATSVLQSTVEDVISLTA